MSDYQRTVIPVIEAAYDSMTAVEKTIADFLLTITRGWILRRSVSRSGFSFQRRRCHVLPRSAVLRDTGSSCITTTHLYSK